MYVCTTKPGKSIPGSQEIEWLGWTLSTTRIVVELTAEKTRKGLDICQAMLTKAHNNDVILAKDVMAVAGFLNFVAEVIKVGRPFIKALLQSLAVAQVYEAWQRGRRRFNPRAHLNDAATQDLTWWCLLFLEPPRRPLRVASGKVFSGISEILIWMSFDVCRGKAGL